MKEIAVFALVFAILTAIPFSIAANNSNTSCSVIPKPNSAVLITNKSVCHSLSINYVANLSNSRVYCSPDNLLIKYVNLSGFNINDSIYGCNFSNSYIYIGNSSKLNLVNPENRSFKLIFYGNSSEITVAYTLNLKVFEPPKYNSVSIFGNRVGAFGYILPSFNNSIKLNSSELQYVPSYSNTIKTIMAGIRSLPYYPGYGVYGENSSAIYSNSNISEGSPIIANKSFILPYETYLLNRTIMYDPYLIDYSFFAYDQLLMFTLNITNPANLTPLYVQPIYPQFNFHIIPNNNKKKLTINWIIVVPSSDKSWNFTSWIYRYNADNGFSLNPTENLQSNDSSFVKILSYPSNGYAIVDGNQAYPINYSSIMGLGLNSSIIYTSGTIPKMGTFIEDSTTSSFSYGIGFCSTVYGGSNPISKVTSSGIYSVASEISPLESDSVPITLNGAQCGIAVYVEGKNISINCNGNVINSTIYGFEINASNNITIDNCKLFGAGLRIYNSTNVTILDTALDGKGFDGKYGISIIQSSNISFYNVSTSNYLKPYYVANNSNNVEFFGIPNSNAPYAASNSIAVQQYLDKNQLLQDVIFAISLALIIIAYVYAFFKFQYKPGAKNNRKSRKNILKRKRKSNIK
ncbi:MAG: hypothetical protein QXN59_01020 [Candidatus Micrarchaeaceae archaeon]